MQDAESVFADLRRRGLERGVLVSSGAGSSGNGAVRVVEPAGWLAVVAEVAAGAGGPFLPRRAFHELIVPHVVASVLASRWDDSVRLLLRRGATSFSSHRRVMRALDVGPRWGPQAALLLRVHELTADPTFGELGSLWSAVEMAVGADELFGLGEAFITIGCGSLRRQLQGLRASSIEVPGFLVEMLGACETGQRVDAERALAIERAAARWVDQAALSTTLTT